MFVLPHSTELRLGRFPWITVTVVVLCLVVHYFQAESRWSVTQAAQDYCTTSSGSADLGKPFLNGYDDARLSCAVLLRRVHQTPSAEWAIERLDATLRASGDVSIQARMRFIDDLRSHYASFQRSAPPSLDAKLVTDPQFPNPWRFLTSTFAHGDWSHLIGNMIFYLAFAPALELLIGSALRYGVVILVTGFAAAITYYLTSQLGGDGLPSLGYSGVVMGMIGLSAYLMPKARIRTFVWFLYFAKNLRIPAWFLAIWYVGWDLYDLVRLGQNTGVALTAHLGGAAAGYWLGRAWLRERKAEVAAELADEIEYMRARRADRLGVLSSYTGDWSRIQREEQERENRMAFDRFLDELHKLVRSGRQHRAVAYLVTRFDAFGDTVDTWSKIYAAAQAWGPGRFVQCCARVYIERLCQHRRSREALEVCGDCLQHDPEFALGDPALLVPLADDAVDMNRQTLALQLVRKAASRYPGWANAFAARLLEARLCLEHAGDPAQAKNIIAALLADPQTAQNRQVNAMAKLLKGVAESPG